MVHVLEIEIRAYTWLKSNTSLEKKAYISMDMYGVDWSDLFRNLTSYRTIASKHLQGWNSPMISWLQWSAATQVNQKCINIFVLDERKSLKRSQR